ncbi:mitochondrial proton/calcium exchanger protein-like protein isoform X1 [Tanacetum coccineum]
MRAFWSLNEDILKITILKTNTPSSKKHFKSLSLDELRSPDFNLLSDKNYSEEEEEEEEMAEYSQKWHNGTSRGRSTETSDGLATIQAQLNNLGREIKKVNEKVYVAQVGCEGYRAIASGYYQRNNANPSFQEQRQSMEDTLSKFMSESAKRHEENCNLIKEIRASTDASIRNQGALIKTLEIQIGQMSKVLQERGFGRLPSTTETNARDQVKLISTAVEADSNSIRRIRSNQYAVSTGQNSTLLYKSRQTTVPFLSRLDNHYCEEEGNYGQKFTKAYGASHINNTMPQKEKDPGSFTLPYFINDFCFDNALVDLGASISVMPLSTYLNLGLGELAHTRLTVELADRTVKYPKGIAENVLVGIEEDQEEDGDDGDTFDTWDITIEDAEQIRKNFNVPDEIDKIEGDFNPTKDLEELERLLSKEPQSNFMEIQGSNSKRIEFEPYKLCTGGGAWILNKLRRSIANRTSWMLYRW